MSGPDFDLLDSMIRRDPAGVRALYQKYGMDPAGISPKTLATAAGEHGDAFTEDFYEIFRDGPRPKKEMAALVGFGGDSSKDRSKFRQWFGKVSAWINGGADVVGTVNDSIVNPPEDSGCPHCAAQDTPPVVPEESTIWGVNSALVILAALVLLGIFSFALIKYSRR